MKRFAAAAMLVVLALAGAKAGAETQWVEREQLVADPADPAVIRFAVEIREPGSYQVRLLARGEAEHAIQLRLDLRPEAGGAERTVRFSFTGSGCG